MKLSNQAFIPVGALFHLDKYKNIISWNVTTEYAKRQLLAEAALLYRARTGHGLSNEIPGTGIPEKLAPSDAQWLLHNTNMGQLADEWLAGNFLSTQLPIASEVFNEGGAEQLSIPAGDPVINAVIQKCAAPNFQRLAYTTVPSSAPKQVPSAPQDKPSPDIQALIDRVEKLNDRCRGGSGDDDRTLQACEARDQLGTELEARGWCYGPLADPGYLQHWMRCELDDSR